MERTLEEQMSAFDHYERGLVLKQLKIYDSAIEEFQRAAMDPQHAGNAHAQVGLCYKLAGRYLEAVEAFRHALKSPTFSSSERVHLLYLLGRALELLGRHDESLETYRWIHGEDPHFLDVARRIEHLSARRTGPLRPHHMTGRSWVEDVSKAWGELQRRICPVLGRALDSLGRYTETLEANDRIKGRVLHGLKVFNTYLTHVRQTINSNRAAVRNSPAASRNQI